MRILFVAPGNSIHSKKWVAFFAKAEGTTIEWISFEDSSFEDPSPLVPGGSVSVLRMIRTMSRVRRAIAQFQPDVVHVHSVARYGLISLAVPRRFLVMTPWGSDVLMVGENRVRKLLLKAVLGRASLLTCDALHMRNNLVRLGVRESRIRIINFGIDCVRFAPVENGIVANQSEFVLLSTRNLEPVYDIATLVRAIPLIRRSLSDLRVIIVGSGSEAGSLQALTKQLGVAEIVDFVGRIPNEELPTLLRSASAYVSTSLSDAGIAGSTAEAMSTGVPVVVSATGENGLWVEDKVSGFLFDAGDSAALARAVVRIAELMPGERKAMAEQARATILDRNDYLNEMNKMLNLYREMASREE